MSHNSTKCFQKIKVFHLRTNNRCLKDIHRENIPSNKTEAIAESMNMYIWTIGKLNQLFITGCYTHIKFKKKMKKMKKMKNLVAKVHFL